MLKAHSLLYAVYVCLIVSILCGALLYLATLYNQLNLFYNTYESLYTQNQSAVNYALGNSADNNTIFEQDTTGVKSEVIKKSYGLLNLFLVNSYIKSDTITSAHLVGANSKEKTCLYISSISKPLSYSGNVKLIGTKKLPYPSIDAIYSNNNANNLVSIGSIEKSDGLLPDIKAKFQDVFESPLTHLKSLSSVEKINNSVYYNSFVNQTIEIELSSAILQNIALKGNFVLYSKDSIQVNKDVILEDVILKSPTITFKEGFSGSVQAFATKKIQMEKAVELNYPSVLCLYNKDNPKSEIVIDEQCKIFGAVVLFGNKIDAIDGNIITINKNSLLVGDIYCYGKLMLEGTVYGTVYTNRVFHKTKSSIYENTIIDAEIDVTKKPSYFVSIPLFENKTTSYGIYKKVL